QLEGTTHKWWHGETSADWTTVALDTKKVVERKGKDCPPGSPQALATWYRMEFNLATPPPKTWLQWRLLLNSSGNGFIYLNDHMLGRYWEAGPQREYYLPECWLNFGPGKTNVVALCLRPTTNGAELRAAEVLPYAEYAERR